MSACSNGHQLDDDARFCSQCGAPAVESSAEPTVDGPKTSESSPRTNSKLNRNGLLVGGVAFLIVLAVGAVFLLRPASGVTVNGTFTLLDLETADAKCVGQGGYSDIGEGTEVTLKDETGEILGSSELGPGEMESRDGLAMICTYEFAIEGVPTDRKQYTAEVADRGSVTSSRDEMEENDWQITLAIIP